MTTLYNLRTDGDQYRITKFVDGDVEASYLSTEQECECPAGHRASCRHRQMIPEMLARGLVNTHWFWDFDRHCAVDFAGTPKALIDNLMLERPHSPTATTAEFDSVDGGSIPPVAAKPVGEAQHVESVMKTPLPRTAWRRL